MSKLYDRAEIYDLLENDTRYSWNLRYWQKLFAEKDIHTMLDVLALGLVLWRFLFWTWASHFLALIWVRGWWLDNLQPTFYLWKGWKDFSERIIRRALQSHSQWSDFWNLEGDGIWKHRNISLSFYCKGDAIRRNGVVCCHCSQENNLIRQMVMHEVQQALLSLTQKILRRVLTTLLKKEYSFSRHPHSRVSFCLYMFLKSHQLITIV